MPTAGIDLDRIEHLELPLDRILVRLDPPVLRTKGGIALPDTVAGSSRIGTVVSQGPGNLSDDGRTRMTMPCQVGDRIMFEEGAGKFLTHVPRETTPNGWGYKVIKAGSVLSKIDPWAGDEPDEKLPPAPGPVPVTHRGPMDDPTWAGRVAPVQDWLLVRMDDKRQEDVVYSDRARRVPLYGPDGRPVTIHRGPDRDQQQNEETWTVTVLRRGPGLTTITRCIDGDRLSVAPKIVDVGDRLMVAGTRPHAQPINAESEWYATGATILLREYECIWGVVERAA
jgi:co-chaperonin GroES (HSP10)